MTETDPSNTVEFAGLKPGDDYYLSDWFELDEKNLREFSHSTYLSPEYDVDLTISKNNPNGPNMVDGFWMVSMLLYFNFKYGKRGSDSEYGFNYGLDRVRFTAPLMLGERVRMHSVIKDIREHRDGTLVVTSNTMEVEGKEKPCMIADLLLLRITPESVEND